MTGIFYLFNCPWCPWKVRNNLAQAAGIATLDFQIPSIRRFFRLSPKKAKLASALQHLIPTPRSPARIHLLVLQFFTPIRPALLLHRSSQQAVASDFCQAALKSPEESRQATVLIDDILGKCTKPPNPRPVRGIFQYSEPGQLRADWMQCDPNRAYSGEALSLPNASRPPTRALVAAPVVGQDAQSPGVKSSDPQIGVPITGE